MFLVQLFNLLTKLTNKVDCLSRLSRLSQVSYEPKIKKWLKLSVYTTLVVEKNIYLVLLMTHKVVKNTV